MIKLRVNTELSFLLYVCVVTREPNPVLPTV